MSIPNVFVSYSHDSQDHKRWVLEFATRLRNAGIDAVLDQWDLGPGDDIPRFMEQHLAVAARVLMICTERYVDKAEAGTGGVGYEKMIVTAELMRSIGSNKLIPIVRQEGTFALPAFLRTKLFIDFSQDELFEQSFDDLVRAIHNAPLFVKPPVANQPFLPAAQTIERRADGLLEIMTFAVAEYETQQTGHFHITDVLRKWKASRLMLELLLDKAEAAGLLNQHTGGYLSLTNKGKQYALEHKLV